MDITVLDYTKNPVDLISKVMGTCYGHGDTSSEKRVRRAYTDRHMGVFEHAKVTLRIDGISRACANQLVRHRMASYCQESQRYCKLDLTGDDWYVKPETFNDTEFVYNSDYDFVETLNDMFEWVMKECGESYQDALKHGVPAEDARYLLPNACKTTIDMTMNVSSLFHFFDLRDDSHAQWEIRKLAKNIKMLLSNLDSEWGVLMDMYDNKECNA